MINNKIKYYQKPLVIIVLFSFLITAFTTSVSCYLEANYLNNNSYYYDSVSYSLINAKLYENIKIYGRLKVAKHEILNNNRNPLRTVPLILLCPYLLAVPLGHVVTTILFFFCFSILLGLLVFKRTADVLFSVCIVAVFAIQPWLYKTCYNFASNWLDIPASYLVGASCNCLLLSDKARNLKWLASFAIFASLATLSRYIAAAYIFVIAGPVFIYYLYNRWKEERNFKRAIIYPLLLTLIIVGLFSGHFLLSNFKDNMVFYTQYGYALFSGISKSSIVITKTIITNFGTLNLVFSTLIFITYCFSFLRKKRSSQLATFLISLWMGFCVPLFMIFVLRTDAIHPVVYSIPLLFIFFLCPVNLYSINLFKRYSKHIVFLLLIINSLSFIYFIDKYYNKAVNPVSHNIEQKKFDLELARNISKEGNKTVWLALFDEYSNFPSMEAFYKYRALVLPAGQDYFFSVHESVFKGNFPGRSIEEIKIIIKNNIDNLVNIAVVLDDSSMANTLFNNKYSISISKFISETLKKDKNWEKIFTINSLKYGKVAGYKNISPLKDNYKTILGKI